LVRSTPKHHHVDRSTILESARTVRSSPFTINRPEGLESSLPASRYRNIQTPTKGKPYKWKVPELVRDWRLPYKPTPCEIIAKYPLACLPVGWRHEPRMHDTISEGHGMKPELYHTRPDPNSSDDLSFTVVLVVCPSLSTPSDQCASFTIQSSRGP